ncbi:hypothetical protein [Sessilibacter corallicola]|uniref:Uncharacterized protein n=1 Tax=Sessilibacter corallicola TaxID=2904075 RepID=A0ABQ0AAU6_9GAMM
MVHCINDWKNGKCIPAVIRNIAERTPLASQLPIIQHSVNSINRLVDSPDNRQNREKITGKNEQIDVF